MGLIKEYVDRAIQTETETIRSPYADPAVVLAAPPVSRCGLAGPLNSTPSPTVSDNARAALKSPASPMLSPLISCRVPRRKHVNRRIVSMPENKGDASSSLSQCHGKRVVSMPDRVRPALEPSAELFQSTSTVAGESVGSCSGRRERVRVFRAPSDVPQTPSPPSSPESLLIIAAGTQLPEGFLRRKYSEPLIEEDEDWITWASSPPRPIPALHGPLSLPYARCPSGAEGTIIEEPDNVAQMIWGLGSDDQPHSSMRAEGLKPHLDDPQSAPLQGSSLVPPRLQKKRNTIQQASKLPRTHSNPHTSHAKQNVARTQRKFYDDKNNSLNQASSDVETHHDIPTGLSWNDGQSVPSNIGVPDNLVNDADLFSADSSRILEWQFARLRQALRTSLADMDYNTYPGRLEPVIPPTVAPGLPQAYPRIFVEPRPHELAGSPAARQASVEIAQQYRQQQLYRHALQKQKLQVQNILPTPPNSSSPQWSSHFSPYLTYCSTFSPEMVSSTEHPAPVPSQKYRSGVNASQYLRHVYDRQEHDIASKFDTSMNTSSAKTPQIAPNVNSAGSVRQSSSSSSTLAKYIKQLQALSPIAHLSPLQPAPPPPSVPLPPLPSTDERTTDTLQNVYPTPPSPESPQIASRSSYRNARSMPPTRSMQRRLSSLPEEDNALLELSTSVSPYTLQSEAMIDSILSSHDSTTGHQMYYLEKPLTSKPRKSDICLPEFDSILGTPSVAFHDSPVKVRLPTTKGNNVRERVDEHHEPNKEGRQYGNRRKHRYKKIKGTTTANEQEPTRGVTG